MIRLSNLQLPSLLLLLLSFSTSSARLLTTKLPYAVGTGSAAAVGDVIVFAGGCVNTDGNDCSTWVTFLNTSGMGLEPNRTTPVTLSGPRGWMACSVAQNKVCFHLLRDPFKRPLHLILIFI